MIKIATHTLLTLVFTFFIFSCATSPTGRRQLTLMPDSQMSQMGEGSFNELKQKTPVERSPSDNAYVRCIALPLARITKELYPNQLAPDQWEIVVFKDPTANAFALPGGKIGVHTGILPVAKTDAQLAAVLGHEIGHVIAKHGNERVSQGMVAQGGLVIADLFSGQMDPTKKNLLMAGLGLGAQYGVLLPFGRTQESEADLIGLDLMSRAGFDPRQSVELWKNMIAASGGKAPPEWMSTHPASENRIRNLQDHFAESMPKYENARAHGLAPHCTR